MLFASGKGERSCLLSSLSLIIRFVLAFDHLLVSRVVDVRTSADIQFEIPLPGRFPS